MAVIIAFFCFLFQITPCYLVLIGLPLVTSFLNLNEGTRADLQANKRQTHGYKRNLSPLILKGNKKVHS